MNGVQKKKCVYQTETFVVKLVHFLTCRIAKTKTARELISLHCTTLHYT